MARVLCVRDFSQLEPDRQLHGRCIHGTRLPARGEFSFSGVGRLSGIKDSSRASELGTWKSGRLISIHIMKCPNWIKNT